MGWTKLVTDEAELAGCQKARWLRQKPRLKRKNLKVPADAGYPKLPAGNDLLRQPALREEMYRAYSTRASDQGPKPVSGTTAR